MSQADYRERYADAPQSRAASDLGRYTSRVERELASLKDVLAEGECLCRHYNQGDKSQWLCQLEAATDEMKQAQYGLYKATRKARHEEDVLDDPEWKTISEEIRKEYGIKKEDD